MLIVIRKPKLCRDQQFVTDTFQRASHELFTLRAEARRNNGVVICGINEVDANIDRRVQHRSGTFLIDSPTKIVGAKTNHGDL
jgi:hypothetical protein